MGTKQPRGCTCNETRKQTGSGGGVGGGILVGKSNLSALARRPFSGSIRRLQADSVYHKQRILPAPSENTTQFIAGGCETESRKCLIGCSTFFFHLFGKYLVSKFELPENSRASVPRLAAWLLWVCLFIYLFLFFTTHQHSTLMNSVQGASEDSEGNPLHHCLPPLVLI